MIPKFSNPSEEFKKLNPNLFVEQGAIEVRTPPARSSMRLERRLQAQIWNLLCLNGVQAIWHRTDKPTTTSVGLPDFAFAIERGLKTVAVMWEVKLPGGKLSDDQVSMMEKLTTPPNAWEFHVITSVEEAVQELRKLGLTQGS